MATTNVSIRLGVEGQAQVKRAFDEVGKAGQDSFRGVGTAMDAAGAATDRETQRLQRLAQAAKQAQAAEAAQRNFNAALGVDRPAAGSARESARVFEDTARAAEDLAARTAALRAQIDPLGEAQRRMNAEVAEADSLFEAGAITQKEHGDAVALAKDRFDLAASAIGELGQKSNLTGGQIRALISTFRLASSAATTGEVPLAKLTVQALKLGKAFGADSGGLTGIVGGVGRVLASVITPAAAATGAVIAVGGAAVFAYDRWSRAQIELQVAAAGLGRTAGTTADQLDRIARSTAAAGGVSVAVAREMQVAFLQTGRISTEHFEGLIKVAKNYAATTGTDVKAATKELADAFTDPVKGADDLNQKLNFLDDRTKAYIRALADQNDRTGAQRVLLDALKASVIDAAEATTALGRAWDFVARMASNAYDALGRAVSRVIDGAPLDERLKHLREERQRLQALIESPPTRLARQARGFNTRLLAEVETEIARIEARLDAIAIRAKEAKANEQSVRAGNLARELTPGFEELQTLKARQAQLRAALDDPLIAKKVADLKQVETAYDAVARAVRTWLDPAEKARRLDELEIQALAAKTPAQKAAIVEERRRIELAGQAIPVALAEAEVTRAGTRARAEATQALIDQARVLDVNTKATIGVADAWFKGAAAAQVAEVRRRALTEAIQNGVDVESRARDLLREQIAEQAAQSAKSVNDLGAEADAQRRLNDAVFAGRLSVEQAQRQMQVEQALRPLIIAQSLAEGEARTTLARIIDQLRGAYARLHGEQARAAALQTLEGQSNQIEVLRKQIELVAQGESQRAIVIAQLQAEQQLRQKGIDLASAEGQAIIANAAAIERLNQSLAQSQSAMQALQGITDTTFNHFANLIAEGKFDWKSWADAGRAAIADIEKEILKLAVLNPLKNFLFGTNLGTLNNVGGLLGNLFGGVFGGAGAGLGPAASAARLFGSPIYHAGAIAGDAAPTRLVPRDLFRIAPRFHDGAFLSPDEVPAILQRGERVLSREETRRYAERASMSQPVINVVIQTPNPAAFQASRTQIAADLARAVRMGTRGI